MLNHKKRLWWVIWGVVLIGGPMWLYFAATDALRAGWMVTVASNARNIFVSLYASEGDTKNDPGRAWPQTDGTQHRSGIAHRTSTEFFAWVVTAGVMNVDFSFFAAPGLTANFSQDSDTFTAAHNAWCIVANVDIHAPENLPVMFSRNVRASNTKELAGRIRDTLTAEKPFGKDGAIVILNGGSVLELRPKHLHQTWEYYLGGDPLGDHPVLRP